MQIKTDMRRSTKAIKDLDHIESILETAPVGILSMCKENIPYSIPVNFLFCDEKIYIHCAKEGEKLSYLKANPQVCFVVVSPVDVPVEECHGAMNYESVLCFGRAAFSDTSPKDILENLGKKYGTCSGVSEADCQRTAMITISIEQVSAKRGYPQKE
ncbi:MAG: pyridoxamine 5'-phosphate oxidase family protein [Theionarchaea archaeon]|nr:pyridoxamine 5'-phosphate oxidase family protein [Theionarchaea archaeon]MBU7038532.1 pyridoxamine 5'-phosphate oxidase family protein [Theionarchaea archaeon]